MTNLEFVSQISGILKSNNKEEIVLAIWLNLQEKNIENNILSWNKIEKLHKLDSNRFTKRAKVQITNMSNLENDKLDEIEIFYEKLETVVLSRKIISSEDEYVKATKEFIENNADIILTPRPRRFGKTKNIDDDLVFGGDIKTNVV